MRIIKFIVTLTFLYGLYTYSGQISDFIKKHGPGVLDNGISYVKNSILKAQNGLEYSMEKNALEADFLSTPGALVMNSNSPTVHTKGELTLLSIIESTNKARIENNVPPLTENSLLDSSALTKTKDMLTRQYFEHESPDGRGISDLVGDVQYEYILVGENLAMGPFTSGQDIVDAWMNSPGHRANILQPTYKEIGVGLVEGMYNGKKVWMAVQHFGNPKSSCPSVDEKLKNQIDLFKNDIGSLDTHLKSLQATIGESSKTSGTSIASLITLYNQKAAEYNALSKTIKQAVDTYNNQVKAFNTCAGVK